MKNDSFYDTDNYKKKRQTSNKSSVSYRTSKTRNASYKVSFHCFLWKENQTYE